MTEELSAFSKDLGAPAPPFLFSQATMDAMTDMEEKEGRYTLERLRERRPEAIAEIIRLVAAGASNRTIVKLVRVHPATVAEVILQEPGAIEAVSSKLAGKYKLAADLLVDRIIENPTLVPGNTVALAISQLTDKAQLLSGGATSRVESVARPDVDPHEAYNALLAALPEADAHVVPAMGLRAGEIAAIGGDLEGEPEEASSDKSALVLPEPDGIATRSDTQDLGADGGAGGVPSARGGPPPQTHPEDSKNF